MPSWECKIKRGWQRTTWPQAAVRRPQKNRDHMQTCAVEEEGHGHSALRGGAWTHRPLSLGSTFDHSLARIASQPITMAATQSIRAGGSGEEKGLSDFEDGEHKNSQWHTNTHTRHFISQCQQDILIKKSLIVCDSVTKSLLKYLKCQYH